MLILLKKLGSNGKMTLSPRAKGVGGRRGERGARRDLAGKGRNTPTLYGMDGIVLARILRKSFLFRRKFFIRGCD